MPSGQSLDEQAQRLGIAHPVGYVEACIGSDERALGVPAAGREATHASPVSQRADNLSAGDEGQRLCGQIGVLRSMRVGVVHAARRDCEDLEAGHGLRIGKLDELEDLGPTELADLDGAHAVNLGPGRQTAHSPPSQHGWM